MILILGGGFAGVSAYNQNKENSLVIDRKDYFLLTPWIIDFICGMKKLEDIIVKYKKVIIGNVQKLILNIRKL